MPCIKSLIADYKISGGICPSGSNPAGWPESYTECQLSDYIQQGQGLCSAETEVLLIEEECKNYIVHNREDFQNTIFTLMKTMCTDSTYSSYTKYGRSSLNSDNKRISRLVPISVVNSNLYWTFLDFIWHT